MQFYSAISVILNAGNDSPEIFLLVSHCLKSYLSLSNKILLTHIYPSRQNSNILSLLKLISEGLITTLPSWTT